MYFPYLRGKQFELIAIRELIDRELISDRVLPVIEPVKLSTSLRMTLDKAMEKNFRIALIANPSVGDLCDDFRCVLDTYSQQLNETDSLCGYILNNNMNQEFPLLVENFNLSHQDCLLIHLNSDFIDQYDSLFRNSPPAYNLIPEQRHYSRRIRQNKVLFSDRFQTQKRNSDYQNFEDEFYSEDHLFYSQEGFVGFSDYSIVGDNFSTKGFAPYAVAIHIVYLTSDNVLRIKHFVSDTNDDYSDVPGKFYEALVKLIHWKRENPNMYETAALRELERMYTNQTYPGLGALKKISIMHHLELMDNFLRENNS